MSGKTKIIRAKLKELKSIDILQYGTEIRLMTKADDRIHSQFFFQQRNADNFIRNLQTHNLIRQNNRTRRSYDIIQEGEHHSDPPRSFDSLNLNDIKNSRSTGMIQDFFIKFADIIPTPTTDAPFLPPVQPPPVPFERSDEYEDLAEGCLSPFEDQIKELEEKLPERKKCSRGNALTMKMWMEFQSEDGRISDVDKIKDIIFRGVSIFKLYLILNSKHFIFL